MRRFAELPGAYQLAAIGGAYLAGLALLAGAAVGCAIGWAKEAHAHG